MATINAMKQWGTMQDIRKTLTSQPNTALGRIGAEPSRFMTVREWWFEMDEPVEMLTDPKATFAEDERELIRLCSTEGVAYRAATNAGAAFPAWLLEAPQRRSLVR